jgi:hypothetical protein
MTLQQKDMLGAELAQARQPDAARRRRQRDDEYLPRAWLDKNDFVIAHEAYRRLGGQSK